MYSETSNKAPGAYITKMFLVGGLLEGGLIRSWGLSRGSQNILMIYFLPLLEAEQYAQNCRYHNTLNKRSGANLIFEAPGWAFNRGRCLIEGALI